MKKKVALALAGLLILTIMLTSPYYVQRSGAQGAGVHDVVVWLESNRNASLCTAPKVNLTGFLTNETEHKINDTDFSLFCPGNWTSVDTMFRNGTEKPFDINYTLLIDWDLDCTWDPPYNDPANTIKETFNLNETSGYKWEKVVTNQGQSVGIEVYLCQQNHLYIGMGGKRESHSEMGGEVTLGHPETTTPLVPSYNITFSYADPETGLVKLVIPAETYHVESTYMFEFIGWVNTTVTMPRNAYGWLFTGNGTDPILGDVDCYTSNNNTGAYWHSPSPKAGELAAPKGRHPDTGPDCIAGTADDGFGNGTGTTDPPGSCILYQLTHTSTTYASEGTGWKFVPFFSFDWTGVWTTAVAFDVVIEPSSGLNGVNSTEVGEPFEFLAGVDHPEYATQYPPYPTPWTHNKCKAYVILAGAWSLHNTWTALGDLDVLVDERQKLVREDCVIADVNCDEVVNIKDIVTCALAFGAKDISLGPDGKPGTPDDITTADPNWNAAGDLMPPRGVINIKDIVRIAIDFGARLTPQCIIRP